MTSDLVKIRASVSLGKSEVHSDIEIPRDEWEAMSQDDRDEYIQPYIDTLVGNHLSTGYEVLDGGSTS